MNILKHLSIFRIDACTGNLRTDNVSIDLQELPGHLAQYFLSCDKSVCRLHLKVVHCTTGPLSQNLENVIERIAEHISALPRKPNGLIVENLPAKNAEIIRGVRHHLKELEITIRTPSEINSALRMLRRSRYLEYLSVDGPYSARLLLEAVRDKPYVNKLNLKRQTDSFDPKETAEIIRTIPKLSVVNLLCRPGCRSDFTSLIQAANRTVSSLKGVNLQTQSEAVDMAALKLSEIVELKTSLAIVLTGNRALRCENIATVISNLLLAPSDVRSPFYLIILRA